MSHMIMMFVYDGAMSVAVCVSYTFSLIAEAMRADIPMPKRIDSAHFRVLVAFNFHTGGKGRQITTKSTTILKGTGQSQGSALSLTIGDLGKNASRAINSGFLRVVRT